MVPHLIATENFKPHVNEGCIKKCIRKCKGERRSQLSLYTVQQQKITNWTLGFKWWLYHFLILKVVLYSIMLWKSDKSVQDKTYLSQLLTDSHKGWAASSASKNWYTTIVSPTSLMVVDCVCVPMSGPDEPICPSLPICPTMYSSTLYSVQSSALHNLVHSVQLYSSKCTALNSIVYSVQLYTLQCTCYSFTLSIQRSL